MNNMSVSALQSNDIPVLNSIQPSEWPSITEIHSHYLNTNCCNCIKVVNNDNEIVGIGTGITFHKTGWLAHIIVSKNHQRNGIGTIIVQDRIKHLIEKCNCQTISLTATDQGYPLYKRLGFIEESMYITMIQTQENKQDQKTNENIVKAKPEHFDDMIKIDCITSGENREDLLKPVFCDGYVYVKDNCLQGFYLPNFGDCGITAITEDAGTALLREKIKRNKWISFPEENINAYNFLLENGYKEVTRFHRMIYGTSFKRNPQYCYSRIGGFAG